MKKLLAFILCFSLVFCLFGCSGKEEDGNDKEEKEASEETTEDSFENATLTEDETEAQDENAFVMSYSDIPDEVKFMFYYNFCKNDIWSTYSYYYDLAYESDAVIRVDENGNNITFHEAASEEALYAMATTNYFIEKAEKDGFVASSDIHAMSSAYLNEIKNLSKDSGYTQEEYIKLLYGEAMTVEYLRNLYFFSMYVEEYIDMKEKNTEITDAEFNEYRELYSDELIRVDLRLFGFEIDAYGEDEAAELAQKMCDRITDEESFVDLAYEYCLDEDKETFRNDGATLAKRIKKSPVAWNIGEDLAEWLYAEERQIGDKIVYTTDQYVYVMYIIDTAYFEETPLVDARHILISFDEVVKELNKTEGNSIDTSLNYDRETETLTLEDGMKITNENTGYSIELVEEAYNISKNIYEEYLKGAKTEESFAEIAEKNSDDTGSTGENTLGGGLYEDIEKGKMVQPFEDWIYDENRKTGDVDIIMTEYGWHIMYFVKHHDEALWKAELREIVAAEKFDDILDSFEKEISELAEEYAEELPVDEYAETALDTFWN